MPSANTTPTTLATDLRRLGLNRTADDLNDRIAAATRKRWSPTVLLEHLVAAELEDRQRRSVERRLTCARLGRFKPLADWDPDWPTALDRPALERILSLDFLARGENVILLGAQGLGKTMLAKNIGVFRRICGQSVGLVVPRQARSVRVCSPPSRRVAPLRPRCAGLTAWTPAPRTRVPALV